MRVLVWICLYSVPLVVALTPSLDFDIWRHLRVGQGIAENGMVPTAL